MLADVEPGDGRPPVRCAFAAKVIPIPADEGRVSCYYDIFVS